MSGATISAVKGEVEAVSVCDAEHHVTSCQAVNGALFDFRTWQRVSGERKKSLVIHAK